MQNHKSSRRDFILKTTAASMALMHNPLFSWEILDDDKIAQIVAKTFGIDTHNHVDVPFKNEDFTDKIYDLAGNLKKSGLGAICMTFSVDRPKLTKTGEAYDRFMTSLDEMDVILKTNNIQRALNIADIKKARKDKKPIVIQSVEGGHFIEGDLGRIKIAYDRGLRHLGLMHDNQSIPEMGDIYTDKPQFAGLTEYGQSVVKKCNQLGILVDLTHCSDESINDALAVSTKPMIVSHTGLISQLGNNEKMANIMKPRLISKEQAEIVAKTGGVIGVWKHLTETTTEYVQNIKAMVEIVGIDHVCIGTDSKLATSTKTETTENKSVRIGEQTNNIWQSQNKGFYFEVVENLLKIGFTESEIGKIGSENYLRVFVAATQRKR